MVTANVRPANYFHGLCRNFETSARRNPIRAHLP
jgi:hypothetical protein